MQIFPHLMHKVVGAKGTHELYLGYTLQLFWNHTWQSAKWRALCTKISAVSLSAFMYRLFHEDTFSPQLEQTQF